MKAVEQKLAKQLRSEGLSVRTIAQRIGCSKGSVSRWVRDIPLTAEQIQQLQSNQDRARAMAAGHPNGPHYTWKKIREEIASTARGDVPAAPDMETLKLLGSALYWAEGFKRSRCVINFSNSDPAMIAVMMRFFRQVCGVPEEQFRGCVHIHPHLNADQAVVFWSRVSGIPRQQFHKTQFGISRASQGKRDTLPLGTFRVIFTDVRLKSRMVGWIEGIAQWGQSGANSSAG